MSNFNITSSTFYTRPNKYYVNSKDKNPYNLYSSSNKSLKPIKQKLPYNFDLPQASVEEMRDELIKLKMETHRINQSYNIMKVDFLKVENDNKKAMMLLESVLQKSGVKDEELNDLVQNVNEKFMKTFQLNNSPHNLPNIVRNFEDDQENLNLKIDLTPENETKLKDTFINFQLKSQIYSMRRNITLLKEEIRELRQNEKTINFNKIQQDLSKKTIEFNHMRDCYISVKNELEDKEKKYNNLESEKENLRVLLTKIKMQNELLQEKINSQYSKAPRKEEKQDDKLEKELKKEKLKSKELEKKLIVITAEINELKSNNKNDKNEKIILDLNKNLKNSEEKLKKAIQKMELLEEELRIAVEDARDLNTKCTDLTDENKRLIYEKNKITTQGNAINLSQSNESNVLEEANKKLNSKILELEKVILKLNNDIKVIEKNNKGIILI